MQWLALHLIFFNCFTCWGIVYHLCLQLLGQNDRVGPVILIGRDLLWHVLYAGENCYVGGMSESIKTCLYVAYLYWSNESSWLKPVRFKNENIHFQIALINFIIKKKRGRGMGGGIILMLFHNTAHYKSVLNVFMYVQHWPPPCSLGTRQPLLCPVPDSDGSALGAQVWSIWSAPGSRSVGTHLGSAASASEPRDGWCQAGLGPRVGQSSRDRQPPWFTLRLRTRGAPSATADPSRLGVIHTGGGGGHQMGVWERLVWSSQGTSCLHWPPGQLQGLCSMCAGERSLLNVFN